MRCAKSRGGKAPAPTPQDPLNSDGNLYEIAPAHPRRWPPDRCLDGGAHGSAATARANGCRRLSSRSAESTSPERGSHLGNGRRDLLRRLAHRRCCRPSVVAGPVVTGHGWLHSDRGRPDWLRRMDQGCVAGPWVGGGSRPAIAPTLRRPSPMSGGGSPVQAQVWTPPSTETV